MPDAQVADQRISLAQIVGLSRHQAEVDKVAERIGHSQYLKATLEAIAAGHPKNRIDDLLPWNFTPSRRNQRAIQPLLTDQRNAARLRKSA